MSGSLEKIATGTAIVFAGMLFSTFFEFVSRVIIARYTTQSEYGTYSIGLALLNFFVFLSCLGLQVSVARCIPHFMGRGESEKVAGIINSSLQLSVTAGVVLFVFVFFSTGILMDIFHLEQSIVIELFAIAIPFLVIVEILSSIFTGFGGVDKRVYFRDALMSLLKISGIALAVILGLGFIGIVYAYLLSTVVTALLFTIYAVKKLSLGSLRADALIRKELFYFSIPLLVTFLSAVIITRTDTLMLGYFKTPDIVGLYNTASPIAQLIPIFLTAMSFIYVSISSLLYSKNMIEELSRNFTILTKWILAATLPFFFIIFFYPEAILNIFFGASYVEASTAMRILAVSALIQVLAGPNAATLVAIGKTKLNMTDDVIGASVNVFLNLLLIPKMGINGAAIASAISLTLIAVMKSMQIFYLHKLHPLTKNHMKPSIVSTALISFIYLIVAPAHSVWMLILLFFLFIAVSGISLIITRSLDVDDITMFLEIEKMAGINASVLKKILKRFI